MAEDTAFSFLSPLLLLHAFTAELTNNALDEWKRWQWELVRLYNCSNATQGNLERINSLSTDRITSLVKRHAACPKAEASLLPTESAKQNPLDDGNCLPQSC